MLHHSAFGRDLDHLSIAVVDNRRPMLAMMRAMLAAIGTGRIDTYEDPADALSAMSRKTPDLVIASASMQPISGAELVNAMRHKDRGRLCRVPAMVMSAQAQSNFVGEALRAGAHQVLVLPTTASTLYRRLDWLVNDDRPFELKDDHYVVAGMEERLALSVPAPRYDPTPARPPLAAAEVETAGMPSLPAIRLRASQN